MNITDLADPVAVDTYLRELRHDGLDDAQAVAEDALDLDPAPAGAWTVLAHVAEHRGDYAGFERWTAAALDADLTFQPSVDDDAYLTMLRSPAPKKAGAALRADHLFCKLDEFTGRSPQLRAQLDLAADVLGVDLPDVTVPALDLCDSWQFLGFLAFEGGLLHAFDRVAGPLLPPAERALLESWKAVRHRHVRMVEQRRRRWKLVDVATGEVLEASTLIETWWRDEREGFVLVVPVGSKLAVVGEPTVFPPVHRAEARAAMAEDDPLAVARAALRWRVDLQRSLRVAFCFPGVDPATVPDDEEALLAFVEARRPGASELDVLLEAIVAHRIITRRTLHTWEMAVDLVLAGVSRDDAWRAVADATCAELWDRAA